VLPFVRAFGEVPPGEALCYRDGGDWVAIAVSGGDAARQLGLRAGVKVTLTPSAPTS
jgi:S-adenosylmethionine hydrolase